METTVAFRLTKLCLSYHCHSHGPPSFCFDTAPVSLSSHALVQDSGGGHKEVGPPGSKAPSSVVNDIDIDETRHNTTALYSRHYLVPFPSRGCQGLPFSQSVKAGHPCLVRLTIWKSRPDGGQFGTVCRCMELVAPLTGLQFLLSV